MANKRALKHAINGICEELFTECIAASLYGTEKHIGNAEALLESILRMQSDYVARISHPEPGMSKKEYYKNLRAGFTAQASEIIDHINTL